MHKIPILQVFLRQFRAEHYAADTHSVNSRKDEEYLRSVSQTCLSLGCKHPRMREGDSQIDICIHRMLN